PALPSRAVTHAYASRVDATGVDGTHVMVPYETQTVDETWEREPSPVSTRTVDYLAVDAFGNITQQRNRAQRASETQPDQDITTEVLFALDEAAHIVSLPARVTQKDASGAVVSDTMTYYDGDPHVGLPLQS